MKTETILNAMSISYGLFDYSIINASNDKRARQYFAFRARILQMDAEKDFTIDTIESYYDGLIDELKLQLDFEHGNWKQLLAEKDTKIAKLEGELETEKEFGMHYHSEFMKLFKKEI